MASLDEMIAQARAARVRAYAPYSGFAVGCCLRGESGRLHVGANVENAAYPLGLCAEAAAIGQMIAAGDRRIVEAVLVAEGDALCTPCGGCRQRLSEFAAPDVPIHLCDAGGLRRSVTMGELLPLAFGPTHLPGS
jgi:cytidine deaminase